MRNFILYQMNSLYTVLRRITNVARHSVCKHTRIVELTHGKFLSLHGTKIIIVDFDNNGTKNRNFPP